MNEHNSGRCWEEEEEEDEEMWKEDGREANVEEEETVLSSSSSNVHSHPPRGWPSAKLRLAGAEVTLPPHPKAAC